ncbi:hypothetical protein [Natrinema amylolyticum]|uniref:hypothetical protein n=1 Tax=Natrinema amylolyticum TaxID=2878679 RepID=UPI001CF9EC6F|nr:hypothetical protein [Natrinema amylolyticum]
MNLALKWHYLDNLSPNEIRDRFEREGIGDYTLSTIRDYLNEKPKEEVIQAIEERNANVRLQAAERFEELYQQALEDHDELAVDDEPVIAMVPKMEVYEGDDELRVSDWEQIPTDDDRRPEWASERDVPIAFTDDIRHIEPGETYPAGAERGRRPEYRKAVVGLRRDQPDRVGRSYARQEAAEHLREKADVLGIYETDINLNTDLEGALLESLKSAYGEDDE